MNVVKCMIAFPILVFYSDLLSFKWTIRALRSGWTLEEAQTEFEHEYEEKACKLKHRLNIKD